MGAVASKYNNDRGGDGGGGGGGGNGRGKRERAATVARVQQKKPQGSSGAEHTKVIFYISREAVERIMLKHLLCSLAEAVAGLDTALTMHVEYFAKDLALPMQSPILFKKPRIERRIRAALANAANDVSGEFERTTRTWFLHGKPWISAKTVIELANTDFVETTLGGVVIRYVVHGERGDTFHQAQETVPQIMPATGCNDNAQDQKVAHKNNELPPPTPTLLDFGTSERAIVAGSPVSTPPSPSGQTDREAIASAPPSSSGQVEKAAIAEEIVADALGRIDHDCSSPFKPPPLSSSEEEEVSSPPTPPLSPPPASVSMDDLQFSSRVAPTPLALLPPAIAEGIVVDGSMDSGNNDDESCGDDSSLPYMTPPLCSTSERVSPASPTPPLSIPSASSMDEPSPSIETPSPALPLPLVPPPPSSPKTSGANPLGEMSSPPLDQPGLGWDGFIMGWVRVGLGWCAAAHRWVYRVVVGGSTI